MSVACGWFGEAPAELAGHGRGALEAQAVAGRGKASCPLRRVAGGIGKDAAGGERARERGGFARERCNQAFSGARTWEDGPGAPARCCALGARVQVLRAQLPGGRRVARRPRRGAALPLQFSGSRNVQPLFEDRREKAGETFQARRGGVDLLEERPYFRRRRRRFVTSPAHRFFSIPPPLNTTTPPGRLHCRATRRFDWVLWSSSRATSARTRRRPHGIGTYREVEV